MRILVTGVTGQIGSALMTTLRASGTLLPADRAMLDLSRPADLPGRLDALNPDVIVNPAAYTAVDRAEDERATAFTVNAESPGVIARWAARRKAPLVHFSTDYVFDGQGSAPWREDDRPNPLSAYGASKLAGERAVQEAGGPHLIVRTSWVYGATGANFLRTIARLANEREELKIVADQFGAPTTAHWIAETVGQILRQGQNDLAAGFARAHSLINVAAAGVTTWHGFAEAIVAGLRSRNQPVKARSVIAIESKDYPTKATRPKNSRLALSRLVETFGITPSPWSSLLNRELDALSSPRRMTD